MSTTLAALDASAAARPVLETALRIAEMTGTEVEALHIGDGSSETPESLAERAGVPLRLLDGPVEEVLLSAVGEPQVFVAVVGARSTPGGRRPVGRVARHILHGAGKPVVIVPPEVLSPGRLRRLVLPLEGTAESSRPVLEVLWPMLEADIELVVLHVFTDESVPRMLDRPVRDIEQLGREFLARHFPHASAIEMRGGPMGAQLLDVCTKHDADLVVLSWSQDSSEGHANVVREVLGVSTLPVLLLPVVSLGPAIATQPRGLPEETRAAPG